MPKFKNVSPLGDLDLPLIGRVVEFGEVFEVTDEQALGIAGQAENWEPVEDAEPTLADLRSHAAELGLSTTGRKSDIAARIAEFEATITEEIAQ